MDSRSNIFTVFTRIFVQFYWRRCLIRPDNEYDDNNGEYNKILKILFLPLYAVSNALQSYGIHHIFKRLKRFYFFFHLESNNNNTSITASTKVSILTMRANGFPVEK